MGKENEKRKAEIQKQADAVDFVLKSDDGSTISLNGKEIDLIIETINSNKKLRKLVLSNFDMYSLLHIIEYLEVTDLTELVLSGNNLRGTIGSYKPKEEKIINSSIAKIKVVAGVDVVPEIKVIQEFAAKNKNLEVIDLSGNRGLRLGENPFPNNTKAKIQHETSDKHSTTNQEDKKDPSAPLPTNNIDIQAVIRGIADELTKAAVGEKFAGKVVRDEIKAGIATKLNQLREDVSMKAIFDEIMTDPDTRKEIIEKFKETTKSRSVVKQAQTMEGLISAIWERFLNLLGQVVFGVESLGQLTKGRVTGFDEAKGDGFVDKLKKNLPEQREDLSKSRQLR